MKIFYILRSWRNIPIALRTVAPGRPGRRWCSRLFATISALRILRLWLWFHFLDFAQRGVLLAADEFRAALRIASIVRLGLPRQSTYLRALSTGDSYLTSKRTY